MNFRSTAILFGLLLGMLWLFGLMVALKKTGGDEALVLPSLQAKADQKIEIDTVVIRRRQADKAMKEFTLVKDKSDWKLQVAGIKGKVTLDAGKVNDLVNQVRNARKDDEAEVVNDPAFYQLDQPELEVTLEGKKEIQPEGEQRAQWTLTLGKTSADNAYVFVTSSDQKKNKVLAVSRASLRSLFFDEPNKLRSLDPLGIIDAANIKAVELKPASGTEVDLKQFEDGSWRFQKPALGFAEAEGPPMPKDILHGLEPKEGGVKGLLSAIKALRIGGEEDFLPLREVNLAAHGLEADKEYLRIQVSVIEGKDQVKKTLLVGNAVKEKGKEQYFVGLVGEPALARIDAAKLEPILKVLKYPGSLRSLDLTHVDIKKVDALALRRGQEELKLVHPDGGDWQLQSADKLSKANDKACQDLVDALQGKKQIQSFTEQSDAELGLDKPVAQASIYVEALEKDSKDKKDLKKVDWKKDVKPAVTLSFGKTDKDVIYVKRVTQDGLTTKLAVPKSLLAKVAPPTWSLAFLDPTLPGFVIEDVTQFTLQRGSEKVEIGRGKGDDAWRWQLRNMQDLSGRTNADNMQVAKLLEGLTRLQAKKWVRKTDPKEDLEAYGLKTPAVTATVFIKKERPAHVASSVALLASGMPTRAVSALVNLVAGKSTDPGEPIVVKFGKEPDEEKDKLGVFATHSGSDLLFLAAPELVKALRETDLRDRSWVLKLQPVLEASLLAANSPPGSNLFLLASPLVTGPVLNFEAAKVKEIKLAVRTKLELRRLHFVRPPGAKTWQDKSGLEDFNLDADKVTQLTETLGQLRTDRFVLLTGGPKAEHKIGGKEATLKIDIVLEDGKTYTLTVGAAFDNAFYFAQGSAWPETVVLLPASRIEPLLRGVGYFAKEQVAGLP